MYFFLGSLVPKPQKYVYYAAAGLHGFSIVDTFSSIGQKDGNEVIGLLLASLG